MEEDDTDVVVDTDDHWIPEDPLPPDELNIDDAGSIDIDSTFIPAQPAWFRKQKR